MNEMLSLLPEIKEAKRLALDTETTGLLFRDKLLGISIAYHLGGDIKSAWYPLYSDESLRPQAEEFLIALFSDPELEISGHNLSFDLTVLYKTFPNLSKIERKCGFFDTKIASILISPFRKSGLKELARSVLGSETPEYRTLLKNHGGKDIRDLPGEAVKEYAVNDAIYTLRLRDLFLPLLTERGLLEYFYTLEMRYIDCVVLMQMSGVKIDRSGLEDLVTFLRFEEDIQKKSFDQVVGKKININSPVQLGNYLYKDLGLTAPKLSTKNGQPSTDRESLLQFEHVPAVAVLLKYKKVAKLLSTYGYPFLDQIDGDGRLRGLYRQATTVTGRLSSSNPNLQNIPSRDDYGLRKLFIAKEGHSFIVCDYKQFEFRLIAHFSQDENFLTAFREGIDVHEMTAKLIYGDCDSDSKRALAKGINFGVLYGMGTEKFAKVAKIPKTTAAKHLNIYYERYPTFMSWRKAMIDRAQHVGHIKTIYGRKCYFEPGKAYRVIDYLAQGSAADIMKKAQIDVMKEVSGIEHCLQVHDELVFECPTELAEIKARQIKDIMVRERLTNVDLDVDVKIVKSWGEAK